MSGATWHVHATLGKICAIERALEHVGHVSLIDRCFVMHAWLSYDRFGLQNPRGASGSEREQMKQPTVAYQ